MKNNSVLTYTKYNNVCAVFVLYRNCQNTEVGLSSRLIWRTDNLGSNNYIDILALHKLSKTEQIVEFILNSL